MSHQTEWEQQVNELKENFAFSPDFDLVKDLHALHLYTDRRDLMRREKNSLKKKTEINHKEIRNLEKALELSIANMEVVNTIKDAIEKISSDMRWIIHTPQRYSKIKTYIARLCSIFHKGTGKMPSVKSPKAKGMSPYQGEFYQFLLKARPILEKIGIDLGKNDNTIGKAAFEVVYGIKKENIPSFEEVLQEHMESLDQIIDL